ncbi:hypothetical protein JXA56_03165 [Candidatus Micrarchaeota archaeon]|nr:hypothetical protein [Candidatus Micrarchaeota archaeon]
MFVEEEIKKIKARNARVEAEKAWEVSYFRRTVIATGTYLVVLVFLIIIEAPNPYLAAAVPAIGFILPTLTLPFLKQRWLRK